jgi:hypothetical protein
MPLLIFEGVVSFRFFDVPLRHGHCAAAHFGRVRRDLFSDDENAGYIEDAALLHRLATERLV